MPVKGDDYRPKVPDSPKVLLNRAISREYLLMNLINLQINELKPGGGGF
jgi:hypothetical protein